jgi:hypothetical protein
VSLLFGLLRRQFGAAEIPPTPTRPRERGRGITLALVAALLLPLLAACGKRGDPVPPEGAPITYPRTYPRG